MMMTMMMLLLLLNSVLMPTSSPLIAVLFVLYDVMRCDACLLIVLCYGMLCMPWPLYISQACVKGFFLVSYSCVHPPIPKTRKYRCVHVHSK
ncbi:hypothetical protein QBC44DRAFT_32227 [Cladorrhinum sp. PSN332]|nr:hypothetical protein QBC44DRAFT_32227 [Cladorrhinum sp. PSN332]